jgi:thiol-disulfide isomerase/thioredoxin
MRLPNGLALLLLSFLCRILAVASQQQGGAQAADSCPYLVLGVARDATTADIKKAYRALTLKYHPDKNPGCEESKDKFTKLVDAYEILGDEDSRVLHDDKEFGAYQSRPHNYNSKAGFYSGNSFVTPLNVTEFDRLVLCKQNPGGTKNDGDQNDECPPWMVEFYTPWCVHCKKLIPEWKRAASMMDGTETPLGFVKFGGVNCETEKVLCNRLGIRAYPSIVLYARDAMGQEHVEAFPSRKSRTVDSFIEFAEKGIRLAHESTLQVMDAFLMHKNVTNDESTELWIVLFEGSYCPDCGSMKASLRCMSANIRGLANFGVLDCAKEPTICKDQYVGNFYPVLKMYPYRGPKGTGETLLEPNGLDPLIVLPVAEKVIRMCIANIKVANGLMNTLHEDQYSEEEEPEPPQAQYPYPQPERKSQYALPAGVRAGGGAQYIAG